jgi:hypothetical protein
MTASATIARLHADSRFAADLSAAKREIASIGQNPNPAAHGATEAVALAHPAANLRGLAKYRGFTRLGGAGLGANCGLSP